MSEYNFRLQKLLDIRLDSEQQCKIKFKHSLDERNKAESELCSLKETYKEHANFKTSTMALRKMKYIYLNALASSIHETTNVIAQKNNIVNEVRQELTQKQIDRKTVETLKENAKAKFIKEQNAIEQKTNDEFALYAYIRNVKRR
jgi:flagellar protein FliJ